MDTSPNSNSRFDVYRTITDKIVAAVAAGAGHFVMPWHTFKAVDRPVNAVTDAPYRGINVVALWAEAVTGGFSSPYWASYRQWQRKGGQVRKGARGTTIVFYKEVERGDTRAIEEKEDDRPRLIARASRVFNADMVLGWEPPTEDEEEVFPADILQEAAAFVSATKAIVREGGERACYHLKEDWIEIPERSRFRATATSTPAENFFAVLCHELTHWSGAKHRLDRQFGQRFGDVAYAMEELTAELGAAFLCADLKIANEPRQDHACYIKSWLATLQDDPKAIFTAASRAQQAALYLGELAASNTRLR